MIKNVHLTKLLYQLVTLLVSVVWIFCKIHWKHPSEGSWMYLFKNTSWMYFLKLFWNISTSLPHPPMLKTFINCMLRHLAATPYENSLEIINSFLISLSWNVMIGKAIPHVYVPRWIKAVLWELGLISRPSCFTYFQIIKMSTFLFIITGRSLRRRKVLRAAL